MYLSPPAHLLAAVPLSCRAAPVLMPSCRRAAAFLTVSAALPLSAVLTPPDVLPMSAGPRVAIDTQFAVGHRFAALPIRCPACRFIHYSGAARARMYRLAAVRRARHLAEGIAEVDALGQGIAVTLTHGREAKGQVGGE